MDIELNPHDDNPEWTAEDFARARPADQVHPAEIVRGLVVPGRPDGRESMRYTVLIDGEAGGYGVVFPDLPGCTAMGETVDKALANAAEAVRDWAAAIVAQGGRVPRPQRRRD